MNLRYRPKKCNFELRMKILVIDNYDSFTWNLVHYLEKTCHFPVTVKMNDKITVSEAAEYDKILLSPGPGLPSESGNLMGIIVALREKKDILGICLGLQALVESYGGTLKNLEKVMHGIATPIIVKQKDLLFEGIPEQFNGGRYHSWAADEKTLPSCFSVTATDTQNEIMAVKHNQHRVRAVQFHPESILSEYGEKLISNWVNSTL